MGWRSLDIKDCAGKFGFVSNNINTKLVLDKQKRLLMFL